MPRYKLLIEYHGAPFRGWQRLPDEPTVQGALEAAAAKLDGAPVDVVGAGRTDAGVHATGQVAHMDLQNDRGHKVADAMNYYLRPNLVSVLKAEPVDEVFHARFSAVMRYYRYVVVNRRADLTVDAGLVWRVPIKLDVANMQKAAEALVGEHDYSTFRDTECQAKSPVRSIDEINIHQFNDRLEFTVRARSFLHRQVRSIVGSLVDVGRGQRPAAWMAEILAARDRTKCGRVAPPDGLYLERVEYHATGSDQSGT